MPCISGSLHRGDKFVRVRVRAALAVRLGMVLLCALPVVQAEAQIQPADRLFWPVAAVTFSAAALSDVAVRDAFSGRREGVAGSIAAAVEPLGRARTIYIGLASSYVGARIAGQRPWADATIDVAAGYVAADAVTALLKGAVGRHRPSDGRGAYRFWPRLKARTNWDSFPSGHATHAFAIAAGIAAESGRPAVAALAYGTAALVGASRVYDRAHWMSDVVAGAVIGTAASRTTIFHLRNRSVHHAGAAAGAQLLISPHVIGVAIPLE